MKKYRWNARKCFRNIGGFLLKVAMVFIMLCVLGASSFPGV